jgi:hypothetical protein
MQGLLRVFLVVKAETLRSEQLPQPMAAEGVVVALVLLLPALAVRVVVSGQRGRLPVLLRHTALVAGAVAQHRQA